ncbi:DciA family protein [Rickettsiales bacterium]|nr:DciA family protein [Rickettsiales bacterium]
MTRKFSGLKTVDQTITNLIKPISKSQSKKLNAINLIARNWNDIIGTKYVNYCKLMSIASRSNQLKLTIISYNSAMTFFLRNNIDIIIEKIKQTLSIDIADISIINQPQDLVHDNDNNLISEDVKRKVEHNITNIDDPNLKDTLRKLGHKLIS